VTSGADCGAPSTTIFQPPDSTASVAEDQDVDVSRAKLPRLPSSKELSVAEVDT
jgi:hypothetical protein